jgi:hypothetical protein
MICRVRAGFAACDREGEKDDGHEGTAEGDASSSGLHLGWTQSDTRLHPMQVKARICPWFPAELAGGCVRLGSGWGGGGLRAINKVPSRAFLCIVREFARAHCIAILAPTPQARPQESEPRARRCGTFQL